jgi:hypothetical protein
MLSRSGRIETKSTMQAKNFSKGCGLDTCMICLSKSRQVQVYAPRLTLGATRPPELARNVKLSGH